jgi:hypothetical protein
MGEKQSRAAGDSASEQRGDGKELLGCGLLLGVRGEETCALEIGDRATERPPWDRGRGETGRAQRTWALSAMGKNFREGLLDQTENEQGEMHFENPPEWYGSG